MSNLAKIRIRTIKEACGLQQSELAEIMEVPLFRIKSLTTGRVNNFTLEECSHLVKKLHINPYWMLTGEGPIFVPNQNLLAHDLSGQAFIIEKYEAPKPRVWIAECVARLRAWLLTPFTPSYKE